MTKDRRLGRGLAALLGSPLEEDQIIDGTATRTATSPAAPDAAATRSAAATHTASNRGTTAATTPSSGATGRSVATKPTSVRESGSTSAARSASGATVSLPESGKETAVAAAARDRSTRTSVTGAVPLQTTKETVTGSLELKVSEIDNNPFQPRRQFNQEEIESLAESIREHQQLQPVLVRKVGSRYQLISGERRLRATIHAGFETIRAEIREADDRLVAELAIVENLQRKDLDAIEKALSFRRYIDQHQCTQDGLAKRLKIDRSTIANLMRLLELPEEIQQQIQDQTLTAGHARALLPLGAERQQREFARLIKDEGWSVRDTERRVSEQLALEDGSPPGSKPIKAANRKRTSPQLASLEQQLRLAMGTKTEIRQTATGRGKIVISFANNEEFDRIFALLHPQAERKAA